MLLGDELVPYVVGECFVHLPKEQVEEKLEQSKCRICFGGTTVVVPRH